MNPDILNNYLSYVAIVVIIVASVGLLVFLFGGSGTSYEEAVAQQKKATSELLALTSNKKALSSKKLKKIGKKVKEKQEKQERQQKLKEAQSQSSEVESDAAAETHSEEGQLSRRSSKGHVEFAENIVEEQTRIRKPSNQLKVRPILINRDDASCISDASQPSTPGGTFVNHFEQIHPKDEMELFTERKPSVVAETKKEKQSKKSSNKEMVEQKQPEKVVAPKEEVVVVPQPQPTKVEVAPAQSKKVSKKEKKQQQQQQMQQQPAPAPAVEEPVVVQPIVAPVELVEVVIVEKVTAPLLSSAAPVIVGAKKKNKKSEAMTPASLSSMDVLNANELLRLISESPLSHEEIQLLTDALLNKQHGGHSEWTEGPNDPLQKVKKQLSEKEKALADEQEASQALHAKLKELRNQLNNERSSLKSARNEIVNMQTALRRATEEQNQLRLQIQNQLTEQNEFQNQRVQLEMHIQRLSDSEGMLMHQLNVLQAESGAQAAAVRDQNALLHQQLQEANRVIAELEGQRQATVSDHHQINERLNSMQMELQRTIRAKEDEARRANQLSDQLEALKSQLDSIKNQSSQNDIFKTQHDTLKAQNDTLKAQHETLTAQHETLKSQHETLKSQHDKFKAQQDAMKAHNDSLIAQHESLKAQFETLRAQSEAQEGQLSAVKLECESLKGQYSGLKKEYDDLVVSSSEKPQQNGVSHEKSEKMEAAIESARAELANALQATSEQNKQINSLRSEITEYKAKNDELRSKNWKVMEALQTAEKALQSKTTTTPADLHEKVNKACEQQLKEIKEILEKGCPQVTVANITNEKEWLSSFASKVNEVIVERKETVQIKSVAAQQQTSEMAGLSRLKELEAENAQLQANCSKFKNIISETEGILSRLQSNVTREEKQWMLALDEKQKELDAHLITSQQMQKKIDALEASLKEKNHSTPASINFTNSLADIERRTEESSRVPTLSEKLNGPPQVGLGEI